MASSLRSSAANTISSVGAVAPADGVALSASVLLDVLSDAGTDAAAAPVRESVTVRRAGLQRIASSDAPGMPKRATLPPPSML